MLCFNLDPDCKLPGLSDVMPWLSLQTALNGFLARIYNHVKNLTTKWLYDKGAINNEVMKAISTAPDLTAIGVDIKQSLTERSSPRIEDLIALVPLPPLPPEIWTAWRQIEMLLHQVSGHNPFGDVQGKLAGTATEAGILAQTASLRTEDKLANGVAEWVVRVFGKMLAVIQEFFDGGSIPILTPDGAYEFLDFQKEDLDAEAVISVDFGTIGRITSDEQKRRDLVMLMSQMAPFLTAPQGVPAAMRELLRRVLEAYHVVDAQALLPVPMPPVDPRDENVQMLLGIPVEPTMLDNHALHAMVHEPALKAAIMQVGAPEEGGQGAGSQTAATLLQAHLMRHQQMASLQMAGADQGGQGRATATPPGAANPSGDMAPVSTQTAPDQYSGVQIPGGF
jgi:hypothetical protein